MFSDFKIFFIPGYQSGHSSLEFRWDCKGGCTKVVTDYSTRRPVDVFSDELFSEGVNDLFKKTHEIDWGLLKLGASNIHVDGPDLYVFDGTFGKIELPFDHIFESKRLDEDFLNESKHLFKLVEKVFKLPFIFKN